MIFITSVVVRNEYFLHEGINDGAIAHHLFTMNTPFKEANLNISDIETKEYL